MTDHEPTDNTALEEWVDRLYDESDRIICALFSNYVDSLRESAE